MLNYLLAPTFQYINTAGRPLSGGAYLEVYIHGTRTKYYCASDFEGNLHPFQIPLDSLGANVVLAEDSGSYDVYAYNRYGSLIMSRYNVKPGSGGGSGLGSITSSDGSIEVTPTSTGVDLKVNGQEPSVLRASADDLDEDGAYTFSALVLDGNDLSVDEHGRIRMEDGWYHYDATVRLVWENSVNDSATVQLYTTLNSDVMEFDLSYAHDETVQLGGEMKITTGGTSFVLGVSGLPNGMVAQLVDLGIHTITGHGDAAGYEAGDGIIIDDHEISIDPSVVQEKLTAGDNIQISEQNVISATDTTYTAGAGLDLTGTEFSVDTSEIQEKLTAGTNIQINGTTISATDTTYTAGAGLDLTGTEFSVDTSVIQEKLTAGSNIVIEGNTISATAEPQLQANWTESDSSSVQYIQNKPQNLVQDADYTHTDNNFTDAEKAKLAGIEANAEVNVQANWAEADSASDAYIQNKPQNLVQDADYTHTDNNFTDSEKAKLAGIEANAEVNVQSDWTESDTSSDAYIQHKPSVKPVAAGDNITITEGNDAFTISATDTTYTAGQNITITNNVISATAAPQLQANWTENDSSSVQYIQNKPSEKTLAAGTHVTLTESGSVVSINAGWPTVDQTYDATSTNAQSGVAVASAIANSGLFEATYGTTTLAAVQNAIAAHKVVYCRVSGRMAFLAYIGSNQVEFQYYRSNAGGTGDSVFVYTVNSSGWTTTERPAYVQSDWSTTSSTAASYIKNKPSIPAAQVNADWNSSSGVSEILNKPTLAAVATSGDYSDLSNTPSIPTATSDLTNDSGYITLSDVPAQVQSDWNESDSNDPAYIQNKPSIPAAQVNSDWNSSSGVSEILNKPTLATVATTGDYSDLSNTPSIPTATSDLTNDSGYITLSDVPAQVQSDWTESDSNDPAYIAHKPTLAAVATSGDYGDLSNTPTINNVPAVTSSDDLKVLKASYTGGVGSYSWETETDTTYSAGTGIDITSGTISVENPLPASTSAEAGKVLKVDSNGDPTWATGGGGGGGVNADWAESDPLEPSYIENKPTPKTLTAGANISISEGVGTLTISAAAGLPASTSADEGKCLVVDSNGDPEWGTGGKTYTGTDGVVVDNVNDTVGLEAPVDLVAGPGIAIDNPDGNTVRISTNTDSFFKELYYNATNTNDTAGKVYSLSEPITNFMYAKITVDNMEFNNRPLVYEIDVQHNTTSCSWNSPLVNGTVANTINLPVCQLQINASGNLVLVSRALTYNTYPSPNFTNGDNRGMRVVRVVGIFRIAGGN